MTLARRCLLRSVVAAAATLALTLPAGARAQAPAREELARLHVLLACDTNSTLRTFMQPNIAALKAAFIGGVPADRLDLVVMEGDEMTPQNILKKIQALPVKHNDAVMFMYIGHGAVDQKTGQHVFTLTREGVDGFQALPRKDVLAALAAKKAGLTVCLSDCCSGEGPILARARVPAMPRPATELSPVMRSLFFQHRGLADMTAAERGVLAWFDGRIGGLFSHSLTTLLGRAPAELGADRDGFVTWESFARRLREETNRNFVECKQHWSNRDQIEQTTQYAWIMHVARPAELAAGNPAIRPQVGWRLGVRVTGSPRGVQIVGVADRSPAAKVGLEAGDVIVSVNGMTARSVEEYARLLDASPQGRARLGVLDVRSNQVTVVDVQLEPVR
jgi:hypothetical protein